MIIPTADRLRDIDEYYFSRKLREVRNLAAQGHPVINLGIGNPDQPPSERTVETLQSAVLEEDAHGYQPYRGIATLRTALANYYLHTYGVRLDSEREVLPLMGSKEGIFHISMAFLNSGDTVLVPDPGYPGYGAAARIAGARALPYPLSEENGWLPDLEELSSRDLSRTKIMWINYPHMPTGAVASRADFERIIRFGLENDILICHDNPYSRTLNQRKPLSLLSVADAKKVAIELNSLSKSHHMPGWRIGVMAGSEKYIDAVLQVKSNVDSGMFKGIQQAAIEALGNSPEWHEQKNALYSRRQALIYEILDEMGFTYRTGTEGMFVWAKAPAEIVDLETFLDELLYASYVFLTPGSVFGERGERYLRMSLCAPDDQIREAADRIKSFMDDYRERRRRKVV